MKYYIFKLIPIKIMFFLNNTIGSISKYLHCESDILRYNNEKIKHFYKTNIIAIFLFLSRNT